MSTAPKLYCDDGSTVELPTTWQICGCCEGSGKSSAYLGAFTQSERDDAGPDFMDSYMRGEFDRACEPCDGTGKVKVLDWKKLTKKQKREWNAQVRDEAADRAVERMERMMGA